MKDFQEPFEASPPAVGQDDHSLAAQIATSAGAALKRLRAAGAEMRAEGPSMEEADRLSNTLILKLLSQRLKAGDAVLTEETEDDPSRVSASRVWIIDPLDGTREFGEIPRTDWAVHVALAVDGAARVGAVSLPALGEVWTTSAPRVGPREESGVRVVVSRTRAPAIAGYVAERLGGTIVEMGSAGAKAMAVLRGDADVYIHAGGQYEWDSCAPVAVTLAAGFHASRLDGSHLLYNRVDPYLPDLVICRPELADRALAAIAEYQPYPEEP